MTFLAVILLCIASIALLFGFVILLCEIMDTMGGDDDAI